MVIRFFKSYLALSEFSPPPEMQLQLLGGFENSTLTHETPKWSGYPADFSGYLIQEFGNNHFIGHLRVASRPRLQECLKIN